MSEKLIDVKNISFSYSKDSPLIFEDISFSVEKGDVLCVLGPNGTGKTTLIKTLNKLYDINSGEIILNGKNIKKLSFRDISKSIGYIPQGHIPSFPFTVFDVVLMGRSPYIGLSSSPRLRDKKIAEDALKTLGIHHMRDKEYTNLSGGERQLVYLTKAIAQDTPILLLDEPTSDLDIYHQIIVMDVLKKLVQDGQTILAAIHDINLAARISDECLLIKNGEVVVFAENAEAINKETIQKGFQVNVHIYEEPFTKTLQVLPYEVSK